jgi:hypothetical protein
MLILLHWNSGDIVLVQHEIHKKAKKSALDQKDTGTYESCAILRTPEDGSRGHKDVVQCIYHDVKVCGYSKVFEVLLISSRDTTRFFRVVRTVLCYLQWFKRWCSLRMEYPFDGT